MGWISYSLTCGQRDHQYYGGDTFTASMTRNDTPPLGAKPKSAYITFTDICVGTSKKPYLKFGDYFTTDGLGQLVESGF